MDPVERILKDYRIGGEEHRLDLFLAYRDLRDRFQEIEREESSTPAGIYAVFPRLGSDAVRLSRGARNS
ncbi:MAG: hypothetical protein OEM42_01105 [Deltaproteobacteria bacterium]|nr:hypothetical protein [Deltaproteobacteria bacterium]MDH3382637.1 hypothetical protein [Deltaproteobacteria bacterium]